MFCPNAVVWGDVATWVGGLATAFTLMVVVYQWWQRARSDQASQVYAYLERVRGQDVETRLGNGSGLPVYDVFIYHPLVQNFLRAGFKHRLLYRAMRWELLEIASIGERARRRLRPDSTPPFSLDHTPSALRVLPPGTFRLDESRLAAPPGISDVTLFFGVEIVFRDSRGLRWTRRASGKLKRSRINPLWFNGNREGSLRYAAERGGSPYATVSRVEAT